MKKKKSFRIWVQIALFLFIALIAVNHSLSEAGKGIEFFSSASVHAVCPFGGVVTLYQLVTQGTFIQKIHSSGVVLMSIVFLSALFLGPLFCGWICPFGTFQELISRIGKRIFKKKFNKFIPYKYDKYLRFIRYIILGLVIFNTARTGKLLFADVDPYYALFQFWTGEVAVTAFIALAVVTVLSLFVERPFCKYFCPYGALLGIFNTFRIFPLRRNRSTCIDCKACDRACPMNIPVSEKDQVRNHQCITCYQCTSGDGVCPVGDTLEFTSKKYPEVKNEN